MKISLISRDNGAGLSTDMKLLDAMFTEAGHDVHRVDWRDKSMPRCDVGIFLELMNPALLRYMDKSVGIFNMEWFVIGWRRYLNNFDQLWAKSHEALDIFNQLGHKKRSTFTGFLTRDVQDISVPRKMEAFHLKGHSDLKGTEDVLQAWSLNPDLPPLTIVSNNPVEIPDNVRLLRCIPDDELFNLMNENIIHVCPSRAEGWAHYITEGLSAGGIVITTNASPMNEQVRPEWGVLLDPSRTQRRGMASEHLVSHNAIAESVRMVAGMSQHEVATRSRLGRGHVIRRNAEFREIVLDLLK